MSEITNWADFTASIQQLPETLRQKGLEILLRNAELIAGLAEVRVPVDTGSLRDSIRVDQEDNSVTVKAGGPTAPYAPFVEDRQPFLYPSVLEVLPQLAEQLKALQEEIRNVAK